MATNLDIDPKLINEAKRLGKHRSKKEAVTEALRQYISHRRQNGILDLMGKIDFDPDWSPRKIRGKKG